MRVHRDCYPCLQHLARQASALAAGDSAVAATACQAALAVLDELFQPEEISIVISTAMHRAIREITGNPDPYLPMKKHEIEVARLLAPGAASRYGQGLSGLVHLSAQGNSIDFFREREEIRKDLSGGLDFAIDETPQLSQLLPGCREIVFLADNAGEAFFDLPLFKYLGRSARVTYMVKGSPVQNDLTLEDLAAAGLVEAFGRVMNTGTATPGIDMRSASAEFKKALNSADLIVAKGMGYFESLPEYKLKAPVFYCLKAKCGPVARSLWVEKNAYVAKIAMPSPVNRLNF